jgi:hypothetical protein
MTRQESINQLCCLVLDTDWTGSTEEYVLEKLGKPLKKLSNNEITDLLMELLPTKEKR